MCLALRVRAQPGNAGSRSHPRIAQLARQHTCLTAQQQQQGPDISRLHPLLQRQWDHAKNLHLGNIVITPGMRQKCCWKCDECPAGHPHDWQAMVHSRTTGTRNTKSSGCPFCSGKAACAHNSLAVMSPVVAAEWSDKNPDRPEEYTAGSGAKKVWHCAACGHDWTAIIKSRTKAQRGCPHCFHQKPKGKKQQQPPVANSQHAMTHWDWATNQEAGLDPHKVTWGSNRRANWICRKCPKCQPHRWSALVFHVCMYKTGCPSCQGKQACTCNSLQSLRPDIANEWDYSRNEGTPHDYTAHSGMKVWWDTSKRGSFEATINSRTGYKRKLDRYAGCAIWRCDAAPAVSSCFCRQHLA